MKSSLASRLGDIPGVASVTIDLEGFGRGIDVRLEPGADEKAVMERLRAILAAYGVSAERRPRVYQSRAARPMSDLGVDVAITPIDGGARIEVATGAVRSFRVVAADPVAVVQGLSDAWCQVIGRVPIEISSVDVSDEGALTVTALEGDQTLHGSASIDDGWVEALTAAVGDVIGPADRPDLNKAAS
ncbi:MAG TPA: hypothetical protein VE569_11705 [Acidimicrobiia bacterium]|jgi:hypothetical protein|nr:hypothetical protein [Acidimicrobiia bacterium]